jgi:hypothetical protein
VGEVGVLLVSWVGGWAARHVAASHRYVLHVGKGQFRVLGLSHRRQRFRFGVEGVDDCRWELRGER